MNIFRMIKKSVYITAVLAIVVGVIFLIDPISASNFIAKLIGAVVVLAGAVNVISYIREKNTGFIMSGSLIIGIVLIAVGIFLIVYSGITLTLLGFVIAIYIIIDGVVSIDSSIAMARAKVTHWIAHLIVAALITAAGVYLLVNPFDAVGMSATIFGIVLIIDGLYGLITAIRVNLTL